jgi:chemotaxis protein methyltransferase CheR
MMAWSHPGFEQVAQIVSARTGLSFAASGLIDAEARIRRAMARVNAPDVSRFLALVETDQLTLDDLVIDLTVGETYFFRESQHFDFIRDDIMPDVLRRRGRAHALRIWSAGCATGEEAYSLAILLEDAGLEGHVLATDISRASLQTARQAAYGTWSLRGADDAIVQRCFRHTGDRWSLDTRFRSKVTFAFNNLARCLYPSVPAGIWDMDLILCRNVLIYLDKDSVRRVAQSLADTLSEGGWLITGPSDPPLKDIPTLAPVITEAGVFYRKGRPVHPSPPVRQWADDRREALPTRSVSGNTPHRPGMLPPAAGPDTAHAGSAGIHAAFDAGDFERVLELTRHVHDAPVAALRVRAIANCRGSEAAAAELPLLICRFPLSIELHLLEALLHVAEARDLEAMQSLRRVLYLDRSLAIAHFMLAGVLRKQGRIDAARRAYRNARDLAAARPPEEPLALAEHERAGRLVELADAGMATLPPVEPAAR